MRGRETEPPPRDVSGARRGGRRRSVASLVPSRLPARLLGGGQNAARDLLVVAVTLLGLGRLVDASVAPVLALLLGLAVMLGTRATLRADDPDAQATVPPEAGLVAGVLAATLLLAARFVPLSWGFGAALVASAVVLFVAVLAERRAVVHAADASPRLPLLTVSVIAAFIGFTAVAGLVDGALGTGPGALTEAGLLALAAADALIAGLLTYRLGRIEPAPPRVAVIGVFTSGLVVALAAGLLRAVAVPTALWPAILTVVFFLWDAVRSSSVAIRRDPRWIWQFGLLAVLSAVVVVWNLGLRR